MVISETRLEGEMYGRIQRRHEVYREKDITHTTRPYCERLLVQTLSDSFLSIYLDRAEQGIEALAVWWITIEQFTT